MFLIPEHIWKDVVEKAGLDDVLSFANETPIGSGAFSFDYWDRGKELKVSANLNHFAAPKCAGIIRIVYGSHDAMAGKSPVASGHVTVNGRSSRPLPMVIL